ncbi:MULTISPECIES: hypothetical protein [unclassified Clostridium]
MKIKKFNCRNCTCYCFNDLHHTLYTRLINNNFNGALGGKIVVEKMKK